MRTIHAILERLETIIDLVGTGIIGWGFLLAIVELLRVELRKLKGKTVLKDFMLVRCHLGTYILLGLEFLIASDIIGSLSRKTLEDLYALSLVVLIRTIISYSLGKEMEHIHKKELA
jgi:uncharacterized membrane protein